MNKKNTLLISQCEDNKNLTKYDYPHVNAVIFSGVHPHIGIIVLGFSGRKTTPDLYTIFHDEESMKDGIAQYIENLKYTMPRKKQRNEDLQKRREIAREHFNIGDILVYTGSSPDIAFYQIIGKKNIFTITLHLVMYQVVREEDSFLDIGAYVIPVKDYFVPGEVITKRITGMCLKHKNGILSKWNDKPRYVLCVK